MDSLTVGEFYETASYKEGHLLSRDKETAVCGRPLNLHLHEWVTRAPKSGRCAECNQVANGKRDDPFEEPPISWEVSPPRGVFWSKEMQEQNDLLEEKAALLHRMIGVEQT